MKNMIRAILLAVIIMVGICFGGCSEEIPFSEITWDTAKTVMTSYLLEKGFDTETDFLSEENIMILDGVKVYTFAWCAETEGAADRLFGMYAVSADGNNYYEYQPAHDEWILLGMGS